MPASVNRLQRLASRIEHLRRHAPLAEFTGRVSGVAPSGVTVSGLSRQVAVGDLVRIGGINGILAEVIRLDSDEAMVRCFEASVTVRLNQEVVARGKFSIAPTQAWKGRMIDAMGRPLDGNPDIEEGSEALQVDAVPPSAMTRQLVKIPVRTGIRTLDVFTPLCEGQRIGIFAGSGVGKSTLLSMLGAASTFQTVVVVLVGERGREVREFAESTLHRHHDRMISIVATGDETPMMRRLAPRTGMRIAEYFRDRGENVLLIMDSVTRYAHACRDVALAAGEAPVARGFPPSVFTELPQLLERAGPGAVEGGFITGIFSVLVDGDDHNDPVADAIRGTLDGHLVLSRQIAEQGRYPAVNLLASISRLAQLVWTEEQQKLVRMLLALVARYEGARDLLAMGAYQAGGDQELDRALAVVPKLYKALLQTPQSPASVDGFAEILPHLSELKAA
jgi:flagellum-specific ATP synthase